MSLVLKFTPNFVLWGTVYNEKLLTCLPWSLSRRPKTLSRQAACLSQCVRVVSCGWPFRDFWAQTRVLELMIWKKASVSTKKAQQKSRGCYAHSNHLVRRELFARVKLQKPNQTPKLDCALDWRFYTEQFEMMNWKWIAAPIVREADFCSVQLLLLQDQVNDLTQMTLWLFCVLKREKWVSIVESKI